MKHIFRVLKLGLIGIYTILWVQLVLRDLSKYTLTPKEWISFIFFTLALGILVDDIIRIYSDYLTERRDRRTYLS